MEGQKSLLERISPAVPVDKFEAFRRDNTYSQRSRKGKERAEEVIVEANDLPAHTPWCNGLDVKVTQSKELTLGQEIAAFVKYVSPTPQEHQVRVLLSSYLTYVVKRRWTDATVTIFGSAAFDLYLPGGDIDMVLNFPYPISDKQRKTMLFQLSSTFKRERVADDVEVRTHAKVPIMTCKTTPEFGNIGIDLSINGEDGIKAIPIVKSYLNKLPALRPLVLVVKRFLSQRNLNSAASGSLSSYSIVCMCISFLQLNPMELDSAAIENIDDSHSLGTLLLNFFDYYGNKFPYSISYISVTKEKLLPKEEDGFLLESHPDLLAIECLVTSGKDISRGAGKIRQIKAAFQEAYTALNDAALVFPFESLLGQILKMSQNTLDHRERVRDLVDSGSLESRLPKFLTGQLSTLPERPQGPSLQGSHQPRDTGHHGGRRHARSSRPYERDTERSQSSRDAQHRSRRPNGRNHNRHDNNYQSRRDDEPSQATRPSHQTNPRHSDRRDEVENDTKRRRLVQYDDNS